MYTPQVWSDNDATYPVSAARMQHLEAGVVSASHFINAQDYGAAGDGIHDDTSAIVNALADLPTYTAGVGGGTVILPQTPTNIYKISASINLPPAKRIIGGGMQASQIQGSVVGDIITVSGANFSGLEHLEVRNTNADITARALSILGNTSEFYANRVYFNARGAGGHIIHIDSSYLTTLQNCRLGGAFSSACDAGLFLGNGSNITRIFGTSFSDTMSGLAAWGAFGLAVMGSHFEGFANGGTYAASVALSGIDGAGILGNYFEVSPSYSIAAYQTVDWSNGLVIGGNTFQTQAAEATGYINLTGARYSTILSNAMRPGGSAPNAHAVRNDGTYAHTNVIHPQFKASGTGYEVLGGVAERAGPGDPNGAVAGWPGWRWWRTDGGTSTTLYVKTSGAGTSTGWTAK